MHLSQELQVVTAQIEGKDAVATMAMYMLSRTEEWRPELGYEAGKG